MEYRTILDFDSAKQLRIGTAAGLVILGEDWFVDDSGAIVGTGIAGNATMKPWKVAVPLSAVLFATQPEGA